MHFLKKFLSRLIIPLLLSRSYDFAHIPQINKLESKVIWSSYIGTGTGKYFSYLHPVNNIKMIFAADRNGVVKALDINNGKEIWNIDLSINSKKKFLFNRRSAMLSGGLSIDQHKIYVGSELGNIYAINITNGNIIWQTKIFGEVLSTLAISNGMILVHTSNGMLMALNEHNGSIKWERNLEVSPFSLRGESTPTEMSGIIIVGGDNGCVNAILMNKGKLIWQQQINPGPGNSEIDCLNDIKSTPIIYNGIIYISAYNGNLSALDFKSGKILWARKIGSILDNVISNNIIYSVDQNNCIFALNIFNGSLLWGQQKLHHINLISPVLYNKYLIIGDASGYLNWVNITTGNIVYKQKIDISGFFSKPIVFNDKIIIQAKNGKLYVLLLPLKELISGNIK